MVAHAHVAPVPPSAQDVDDKHEVESVEGGTGSAPSSAAIPSRVSRSSRNDPTRNEPPKDSKGMQKLIYSLLDTIASHRDGNVFQNPVKRVSGV